MPLFEKLSPDLAEESVEFILKKYLCNHDLEILLRSFSYGGEGLIKGDDEVSIIRRGAETIKFIINIEPRVVVKIPKEMNIWQRVIQRQMNGNGLLKDSNCQNFAELALSPIVYEAHKKLSVICQPYVEGEHANPSSINRILFPHRLIMEDYYAVGNAINSERGVALIDLGMIRRIDF